MNGLARPVQPRIQTRPRQPVLRGRPEEDRQHRSIPTHSGRPGETRRTAAARIRPVSLRPPPRVMRGRPTRRLPHPSIRPRSEWPGGGDGPEGDEPAQGPVSQPTVEEGAPSQDEQGFPLDIVQQWDLAIQHLDDELAESEIPTPTVAPQPSELPRATALRRPVSLGTKISRGFKGAADYVVKLVKVDPTHEAINDGPTKRRDLRALRPPMPESLRGTLPPPDIAKMNDAIQRLDKAAEGIDGPGTELAELRKAAVKAMDGAEDIASLRQLGDATDAVLDYLDVVESLGDRAPSAHRDLAASLQAKYDAVHHARE